MKHAGAGAVSKWTRFLGLCLLSAVLMLSACGDDDGGGGGDSQASTSGAKTTSVKLALGSRGLVFAPVVIADAAGIFEKHGLDVELVVTGSGAVTFPALLNGDTPFGAIVFSDSLKAAAEGQLVTNVSTIMSQYATDVVVTKEFAEKNGITGDMEWQDSIGRMKGATIAIATVGSGSDLLLRFLLKEAGLDPDKDVTITPISSDTGRLAAFRAGRIDSVLTASPVPETLVDSVGAVYVARPTSGGVEPLDGFVYTTLAVNKQYGEKNPDVVSRMVAAMAETMKLIHDDPAKVNEALSNAEGFSELSPEVLDQAIKNNLPAIPASPVIPDDAIAHNAKLLGIESPPTADQVIDNSYAEKVAGGE
ncbi:MAG TPA: ABC transporter substrate-binding protein [Solirubrobacteraceae bacterium]|nr:ABC transporter substrate-binding protein [Solirubrobacteraceae bacterium]